jgi:hypothetical protein
VRAGAALRGTNSIEDVNLGYSSSGDGPPRLMRDVWIHFQMMCNMGCRGVEQSGTFWWLDRFSTARGGVYLTQKLEYPPVDKKKMSPTITEQREAGAAVIVRKQANV